MPGTACAVSLGVQSRTDIATSQAAAKSAGLHYVGDGEPGLSRARLRQKFVYPDSKGRSVRDPRVLDRIRSIVIPPAWTDVWICARSDGHVQATGRDARGRKQHRYHPDWTSTRNSAKYDRMIEFALELPAIRRRNRATTCSRPWWRSSRRP